MSTRHGLPGICPAATLIAAATLTTVLGGATAARADVVGRIHITVTYEGKPVSAAKITLSDPTNVRADIVLTTDARGEAISPLLENHPWQVATNTDEYQNDIRNVTVSADTITDVEIRLRPITNTGTTKVRVRQNIVRTDNPTNSLSRNQNFYQQFPVTAGTPQSLSKALRANPGFVEDSANQAHPRGEHASTAIYINGFELPGALQGRAGAFLSPQAIQTLDVQTGGYAPEYGGETAAILNMTLRAGTVDPFIDANLGGGGYGTFTGSLTAGGQFGAPTGGKDIHGDASRKFSYLVNATQYQTANALESPQPDKQTAHNGQDSATLFGNFSYAASPNDQFSLILNDAPARTEIANRTGLSGQYTGIGQGYGYAGAQDAGSAATLPGGQTVPLVSQQDAHQDVYQLDSNGFGALQYRRQFSATTSAVFNLGYSNSRLDIKNHNPGQYSSPLVDPATLASDSSIEFSPTLKRDYNQGELAATFTRSASLQHTIRFGGLYQNQHGDESYQFVPGSQLALNALYSIDPRLAPAGGTVRTDESGNPVTDANGNTVYKLSDPSATPTLKVKRNGYYGALFAQDTYKPTRRFTVNYGLRLDMYRQSQDLGQATVNKTELSPRVNTAYVLSPLTVLRLSYDHLFTQPPLAQGAVVGESIKPQISNLYEADLEKQFGQTQSAKISYYQKYNKNQIDTGILIPGTQIGAYATVNFDKSFVKGTEVSYNVVPRGPTGFGGYLSWANTTAKPQGFDNTGAPAPKYNDHDQLNTIGAGVDYTFANGMNGGVSYYYGTGVESSRLSDTTPREPHKEVNLRLSTGQKLAKSGIGVDLDVQNLFDDRARINFQSGFSGTRFQQGRRVILSLQGRF